MGSGECKARFVGLAACVAALSLVASCTLYHSKIPMADTGDAEVSPSSVFVTEDDSGLALLGIFVISEPDHYSVLVERARRRYKCERLHHVQLDFYSDYWLFVGFPIARITAICEPVAASVDPISPVTVPSPANFAPDPIPEPTPTPQTPTPDPVPDTPADSPAATGPG